MKTVLFCAAMLVSAPFAANAQTAPAAAAPAAPAADAPSASTVLNGDTPIETIAASAEGKAALNKEFPDLLTHPAYEQFKGMSLRALEPLSGGTITDEKIAAFEADVKASAK